MAQINIKRVYEKAETSDGYRILIDRLWPRGKKKEEVAYDFWAKEIAPSNSLREWFHKDQDGNWSNFKEKYINELKKSPAMTDLINRIKGEKVITLLYASKNTVENNAIILKEYLEDKLAAYH